MTGDVYLIKGTVLKVLVGQLGSITNTASYYNPGGGGTFVTLLDNTPLIIAGGGGGQGAGATPSSSYAPTTTTTLPSGTVVAGYDVSGALATAGGSGAGTWVQSTVSPATSGAGGNVSEQNTYYVQPLGTNGYNLYSAAGSGFASDGFGFVGGKSYLSGGESGIGNCAQNPNTACVESFVIIKADGSEIKASPLQQFPKDFKNQPGWKSPNNDGSGYPALLASWIWRAEGDAPGSEHDYYLSGNVSWGATADKSRSSSWSPSVNEFFMEVTPIVRENSSLIKAPSRTEITNVLGSGKVISFSNSEEGCLANDTGVCLHRRDFPEGLRYRLTLQMPRNIAAWLNGRLDRPTASVEKLSSTSERITVEAAPAENIFGGSWVKYSSIPSSFFTSFAQPNPFQTIASKTNNMMILDSGQDKSLEYYKAWAPYLGEKAYSINKTWTLSNVRVSPTSTCVKQGEGLQGIVATNASAYDAAAPTYDSTSGTLDYHVAAPHFKADGVTPNVGSYGLTMSASLLQCMYGISSVPSEASIAITDSDGKQTIQTVALGQQNGWVHLNANNFSFSSPTLKIKLNQAQAATPVTQPATTTPATTTPATTPAISATAATKKSTITCVKGKTTKKVTGTKPTCPAGYKKK